MNPGGAISKAAALLAPLVSGRTVLVAMSGGVDSTVAAALLMKAGADVIGGTLKFWDCDRDGPSAEAQSPGRSCCCLDGVTDARNACLDLGIPHYAVDVAGDFESLVRGPALAASEAGLTPNPCVLCNRHLKFGSLAIFAEGLGIDLIATGHYARVERPGGPDGPAFIARGCDPAKDQSYFLFALPPEVLDRLVFPLGTYEKPRVRAMAREIGLDVSDKPESQDLCFPIGRAGALEGHGRGRAGRLVGVDGTVLGRHGGVGAFTIGQRRGHGVSHTEPLYVKSIDPRTGDVILATDAGLYSQGLRAPLLTWFGMPGSGRVSRSEGYSALPDGPFRAMVQIRYRARAVPATVTLSTPPTETNESGGCPGEETTTCAVTGELRDMVAEVRFDDPQRAVTPGQALVIYDRENEFVLGGGWIEKEP